MANTAHLVRRQSSRDLNPQRSLDRLELKEMRGRLVVENGSGGSKLYGDFYSPYHCAQFDELYFGHCNDFRSNRSNKCGVRGLEPFGQDQIDGQQQEAVAGRQGDLQAGMWRRRKGIVGQ